MVYSDLDLKWFLMFFVHNVRITELFCHIILLGKFSMLTSSVMKEKVDVLF